MGQSPQRFPEAVRERLEQAESFSRSADEAPPLIERLPNYAGAFLILAGLLSIIQAVALLTSTVILPFGIGSNICFLALPSAILGFASIFGGWLAFRRESYSLAMLGAVCAVIGVGFGIGAVLGVASLIMLGISRNEF